MLGTLYMRHCLKIVFLIFIDISQADKIWSFLINIFYCLLVTAVSELESDRNWRIQFIGLKQGCHARSLKILESPGIGEKYFQDLESPWICVVVLENPGIGNEMSFFISKNNINMLLVKIFLIRQCCKTKTVTS